MSERTNLEIAADLDSRLHGLTHGELFVSAAVLREAIATLRSPAAHIYTFEEAGAEMDRILQEEPNCLNCKQPQPHPGAHFDGTEFTCDDAPTSHCPSCRCHSATPAASEAHAIARECPGEDCPMCNGEACNLCGAGCWGGMGFGTTKPRCEHDVIERHKAAALIERLVAADAMPQCSCYPTACNDPRCPRHTGQREFTRALHARTMREQGFEGDCVCEVCVERLVVAEPDERCESCRKVLGRGWKYDSAGEVKLCPRCYNALAARKETT